MQCKGFDGRKFHSIDRKQFHILSLETTDVTPIGYFTQQE